MLRAQFSLMVPGSLSVILLIERFVSTMDLRILLLHLISLYFADLFYLLNMIIKQSWIVKLMFTYCIVWKLLLLAIFRNLFILRKLLKTIRPIFFQTSNYIGLVSRFIIECQIINLLKLMSLLNILDFCTIN